MTDANNDNQRNSFVDETADVTIRREIIKFYGPALGRGTMGTLVFFKDLALRHRDNDPGRTEKDEFSLSYGQLTNFIGCSREALAGDIKKMTDLGLLSKVTEKALKSDKKWNETNRYRILYPDFNPSQELVRKYWPSWWIRPDIKGFKTGSSETEPQNQTTSPSSSETELRGSGSKNELRKITGSSNSGLPTSSEVRLPNGSVVVVKLQETTTPDFVAVFLIDEIKRCQKYYPDFNARTMLKYWKKAVEKCFEKPGATFNDAIDRCKAVLDVADTLKKAPNNFLIWYMAGVRDGYEPTGPAKPKAITQEELEKQQLELRRKKEEQEKTEEKNRADEWEKERLTAPEETILGAYNFAFEHLKKRGTDPLDHIKKHYAGNPNLEIVLKKLSKGKG